jgi:hypothetical protein
MEDPAVIHIEPLSNNGMIAMTICNATEVEVENDMIYAYYSNYSVASCVQTIIVHMEAKKKNGYSYWFTIDREGVIKAYRYAGTLVFGAPITIPQPEHLIINIY